MSPSLRCAFLFLGGCLGAFAQSADIGVAKTGPETSAAGSNVSYTITVSNFGPDSSEGVTLTDPIPAGMTFVSLSAPAGFSCSAPPAGSGGTVSCSAAPFAFGASGTFTLVVKIPPAAAPGTTFTNIASVGSGTPDPNDENNSAAQATTVPIPAADVSVNKSAPGTAVANSNLTYSITVANSGPNAATTVALIDSLPAPLTFVSLSQSGPAFACSTPAPGAGGTVSCTRSSLAAGASTTFTIVTHIPSGTASGTDIINAASVTSDADLNPENDATIVDTTVTSADLSITKSGPAGSVLIGGTITYSITVGNNGPDAASDVSWTDSLPAGTTFASLTQNTGPGFACSTPGTGSAGTVACSIVTLNPGSSAQFSLVVNVTSGAGTSVTNTASVSSASADPNPSNNSATSTVQVSTADLSITKSGPVSSTVGSTISYTITVTNNGPSAAQNAAWTDTLPSNTTFASLTQNNGPSFTCSAPSAGSTGAINCTLASMNSSASAQFSLVVNVTGGAGTTITNTATVSSASDPNSANDSASAGVPITPAGISIVKTGPASVAVGGTISYTITVTNNSAVSAQNVAWTDVLPSGTTFASLTQNTGPSFTCSAPASGSTGTINCTLATMSAGSAQFTLVVNVTASAGTTITNTATVASISDPSPANKTSTAAVQVTSPDLSITKTGPTDPAGLGGTITYTILVANNGSLPALTVVWNDVLPSGTNFASLTQNTGPSFACSTPAPLSAGTVTCSLPSLPAGGSAQFRLVVNVVDGAGTTITNTATVSSPSDTNLANNSSSFGVAIAKRTTPAAVPALPPPALVLLSMILTAAAARALKRGSDFERLR